MMNEIRIKSPVFEDQETIPERYTCDGENTNPPLEIQDLPEETKSVALIVDDPDAPHGTFTHWIACNILPDDAKHIEEGYHAPVEGSNGFGSIGYGGPCPPSGTHRYLFKVYALDSLLDLTPGFSKEEVEQKIEEHIVGRGKLVGLYSH